MGRHFEALGRPSAEIFPNSTLKSLKHYFIQEGAHEHIAEARHFFGSNPGGTTLKCEKLKFLMDSRNHWGLYGNDLVH